MTIQTIGRAGVALYLTPADLSAYRVTPAGLTLKQAGPLVREACRRAGILLEGPMEIEAYPECQGVLLFAHPSTEGPVWVTFDGLEPLLRAALALHRAPVDAALWWWEGRYWLALPPQADREGALCREFGSPQWPGPGHAGRLEREGRAVFRHHALFQLCRDFLRLHLENL